MGQLERTWTSTDTAGMNKVTETAYTYDVLGRLAGTTATWRNAVDIADESTTYAYDDAGALDTIAHASGLVEDHNTNALGRVENITHFNDANNNGQLDTGETVVSQFDYTYDAAGNRLSAVETINGQSRTFTWAYDGLNRLVKETLIASDLDDYIHNFSYDLSSNRVGQTVDQLADGTVDETTAYTHDRNDRLLSETSSTDGTTTYGYNDSGEQTSKTDASGTTNYRFDVSGRLVGIDTNNDGVDDITYGYNDQGLRVSQTDAATGQTTTYHFDPRNPTGYAKAIEEYVDGVLSRSYTFGHRIEAQHDATAGSQQLLHDLHGSTRALIDTATAAVLATYTYEAFGSAIGFDASTAATTWLFANDGQYDPASGFTYHLERWRNGHVFLGMDPFFGNVTDPLSLHKLNYVHGNPVSGVDPSGLFTMQGALLSTGIILLITTVFVAPPVARSLKKSDAVVTATFWLKTTRDQLVASGWPDPGPSNGSDNAFAHALANIYAVRSFNDPLLAANAFDRREQDALNGGADPLAVEMDRRNNALGNILGQTTTGEPIQLLKDATLWWIENGVLVSGKINLTSHQVRELQGTVPPAVRQ